MIYRRQQTIDAIYDKYCACQKIVLENKNVANSPFGQDGSLDFLRTYVLEDMESSRSWCHPDRSKSRLVISNDSKTENNNEPIFSKT